MSNHTDTSHSGDLVERLRSVDVSWSETGEWCAEAADRIEALEAEIERLREAVDALLQHDASSFWGADAEKNRRASYLGVIRKAKKARAALGEKQ